MKMPDPFFSLCCTHEAGGGMTPAEGVRLYQIKREIEEQIVRALMRGDGRERIAPEANQDKV